MVVQKVNLLLRALNGIRPPVLGDSPTRHGRTSVDLPGIHPRLPG